MDRRRILLVVAVIVAALGVGLVFVYAQGADNRAQSKVETTSVLVATQEIPAGMAASDAAAAGRIVEKSIPTDAVLQGATADGTVFKNQVALTNVYPGEQLLTQKFGPTSKIEVAAQLPIPKGDVATTISLDQLASVGDFITPGSSVCMYLTGTFPPDKVSVTRVLLAKVNILAIGSQVIGRDTDANPNTLPTSDFTLALSPHDNLVLTQAQAAGGKLSLGLLGPGQTVKVGDQITQDQLFSSQPGNN